ncbi:MULTISPECIES: NADP-dependent oxidoreductase [unclassified Streptomyces]|uniref:NADP-dependent oxidoreductase n=1 Tax=unclassified Streptomyces TaxID=2593676 RepID=UPI002DD8DA7D|nr:NADP-dependent oxidoreductase [Streptomyces sp. NBC_01237]WRZ70799.1 NADP-dependent oxidoreductase [Streptomyces sp. NBC_01237]
MPKVYIFHRYGGPEAEAFSERPVPVPGPGELLVAVRAAGVNPVDWKRRSGLRRPGSDPAPLPGVFGSEVSGTVEAVGPGVEGFAPGQPVFGSPLTGGYAEYALLAADATAHKPDGLSFTDAAVLPVAAATAYDGLRQLDAAPGSTLLVTGAGGGVGVAAVQLARHFGIRVLGTASAAKQDLVESLGAVHVTYGPGVEDRIRAAAPEGVDAAFDLAGGEALTAAAAVVGDRKRLISAGSPGEVTELGGAAVRRTRSAAVLDELARLVVGGALRTQVTRTFPLAEADRALRTVEGGHARGKIVIEVAG